VIHFRQEIIFNRNYLQEALMIPISSMVGAP